MRSKINDESSFDKKVCYMSDKAAQLLDADVLRKFFADLNTVALDGNFDRKALSARRED